MSRTSRYFSRVVFISCLFENIDLSEAGLAGSVFEKAIFKNGNVLILDEPTSALDGISEEQVFKTINSIHRTVLCVFHKINHLYKPDKILVLDKNTCVGFGEHEKLLSECQLYRKIYESQNKQVVRNHV